MKLLATAVVCLLAGGAGGWYGYEYRLGASLLDSAAMESTLYLGRSQELHEKLNEGDVEGAKQSLIESMKRSIGTFETYREEFCIRSGADYCDLVFERVDRAKAYIKSVDEDGST